MLASEFTVRCTTLMRQLLVAGRFAEARDVLRLLMVALTDDCRPDYETRCRAFQGIVAIDRPSVLETPRYG